MFLTLSVEASCSHEFKYTMMMMMVQNMFIIILSVRRKKKVRCFKNRKVKMEIKSARIQVWQLNEQKIVERREESLIK